MTALVFVGHGQFSSHVMPFDIVSKYQQIFWLLSVSHPNVFPNTLIEDITIRMSNLSSICLIGLIYAAFKGSSLC